MWTRRLFSLNEDPGPDARHELVFGDRRTACFGKHTEDIERAAAQLHRLVTVQQPALAQIEPQAADPDALGHSSSTLQND